MYDPARVWRFTGDPFGPGGSRLIGNPAGGWEERQDLVAQQAVHERPAHVMVGRFKRKGVKNIILQGVEDSDLYPVFIRR